MTHATAQGGFPGFPCNVQLSTTPSSLNTRVEQSSPCVRHGTLTLRSHISPPSHHIFHHSHEWPGVSDSVNNISCLTAKLSGRIGHVSASWLCLVLVYSEYGLHGAFHKYCQMLFLSLSCKHQVPESLGSYLIDASTQEASNPRVYILWHLTEAKPYSSPHKVSKKQLSRVEIKRCHNKYHSEKRS